MGISSKLSLKKGNVLISRPLLNDDYFHKSVVLLTDYHEEVVGFIINKPSNLKLSDVISDFPEFDSEIHYGGPVAPDNLYFIHRVPEKIEGSIPIVDDLYWGGDFNQVRKLITEDNLNTDDIRFFLGYSGWGSEQLDEEIQSKAWIIDELEGSLFNWETYELWKKCMSEKEKDFEIWMDAPQDVRLN
jgi:putative transcriptional regulator